MSDNRKWNIKNDFSELKIVIHRYLDENIVHKYKCNLWLEAFNFNFQPFLIVLHLSSHTFFSCYLISFHHIRLITFFFNFGSTGLEYNMNVIVNGREYCMSLLSNYPSFTPFENYTSLLIYSCWMFGCYWTEVILCWLQTPSISEKEHLMDLLIVNSDSRSFSSAIF